MSVSVKRLPVIITRYIIKEILQTLGGVLLVLMLMAVSAQLVGLFSKVADGTIQVDTVLRLFGVYSLTLVPFIVPLALYLAVLLTLTRFYRDSEMDALAAGGFGPFQTMRAVLIVAILVAVFQALFTLVFAPWGDAQGERLETLSQKTVDIQGVTPGRFRVLPQAKGVIYVEKINEEGTEISNIFAGARQNKQESMVVARSGFIDFDASTGDRYLILRDGYRYEGRPGMEDFMVVQFKRHGILLEHKVENAIATRHRSIPSNVLMQSDDLGYLAEFQWRISSALFCIVLAALAVPLSRTSHRQGRYVKLVVAVVLYLVISNLLNVARAWVYEGQVPPEIGMWWVHMLTLILAIILILMQTGTRHYFKPRESKRASV